jgi:hypothetical protein
VHDTPLGRENVFRPRLLDVEKEVRVRELVA